MMMTRVSRRVLMTVAILALVVGVGTTLALLGCGSDGGGSSDLVGPAEDIVIFPGGVGDGKLDDLSDGKSGTNYTGIDLGTSGYFHARSVIEGGIDNHYFMTKTGVSYQVEVIAEGDGLDVDLYLDRSVHPYNTGYWKRSSRAYPLMDGIVFKSTQDGKMYVDVRGVDDAVAGGTPPPIPYHIHVRKCQFGTFNQ